MERRPLLIGADLAYNPGAVFNAAPVTAAAPPVTAAIPQDVCDRSFAAAKANGGCDVTKSADCVQQRNMYAVLGVVAGGVGGFLISRAFRK